MIAKRLFDIVFSGIGLVLLMPLYLITAIAIRLDTPGPVFFRQVRVGRNGVPFRIHKFRTMRVEQNAGSHQITVGCDPRITRIGRFLRKAKIDELPQLFDVFLGLMSLVGPRPEVPKYVQYYPDTVKTRVLSIRPGITDECSLKFINESELLAKSRDPENFYIKNLIPMKLACHLDYVDHRSMMGDVSIILKTIRSIVR